MTILDLSSLARAALGRGGDRPSIAYDGSWRSAGWTRRLAEVFDARLGNAPAVGLVARNRPHHVVLCAANIAARRTTSMINFAQSAEGIARDIRSLALPAVVADRADWSEQAIAAARDAGTLALATDENSGEPAVDVVGRLPDAASWCEYGDVALALLSSGTTGLPKRVALSWGTIAKSVEQAGQAYAGSDGDAPQVMVHPLGNVAGLGYAIPPLVFARRLVLLDRFNAQGWAQAVRDYRPQRGTVPPAGIAMLLASDVPRAWLSSLVLVAVGGGALPVSQHEEFEARFGVPVLPAYGATEFGGVVANWTLDLYRSHGKRKRGSAGRPSQGVELRVVDETSGAVLGPGEVGLLEVRAERIGDRWNRTTDLALIDDDGFLFLKGRADGAINRGGFKIVPEALADVLRQHPGVRDAAIVGLSDARLGEVPVAAVEAEPEAILDADDLTDWLRNRVAAYQVPVAIRIVETLPRNVSMKVSLAEVRSLFDRKD